MYDNRYCNQDDFSVLGCWRLNENIEIVNSVYKLDGRELKYDKYTSMPKELDSKTTVINLDLFVLAGNSLNDKFYNNSRKFCNKAQTWSIETELSLNDIFICVCSLKNKLFVVYGEKKKFFVYNLKNNNWFRLADTKQKRHNAAFFLHIFCRKKLLL